jgi:hypothetical protein
MWGWGWLPPPSASNAHEVNEDIIGVHNNNAKNRLMVIFSPSYLTSNNHRKGHSKRYKNNFSE